MKSQKQKFKKDDEVFYIGDLTKVLMVNHVFFKRVYGFCDNIGHDEELVVCEGYFDFPPKLKIYEAKELTFYSKPIQKLAEDIKDIKELKRKRFLGIF